MRLSRSGISALLCTSVVASVTAVKRPVQEDTFPWPWPRRPRTTTVIDLLSSNAEFSPLLKALQQNALIPLLNSSENMTLLAPTSDAMNDFEGDVTRDLLMYHILNGSVLSSMVDEEIVVESLLKMDPKDNTSLGIGVKIEKEGDRGRGQGKLRIGGIARVVKSDWEANNGEFLKGRESVIEKTRSLSTFNSLYEKTQFPFSYALFAPDNSAFDVLHPVELSYLGTRFADVDRKHLLYRHATSHILYANDLREAGNASSLEGEKIHYRGKNGEILVDSGNLTAIDIVAHNGVVHITSKLIVPSSLVFTPIKYLYGLHDDIFAQTLAASDSFSLANDSSIHQTIFAPINNAYSDSIDTEEVLRKIRYNFINEPIGLESIQHGDLLETKYPLNSLDGANQKIKVTMSNGKIFLNNDVEVLPDAVQSGNTVIYEIDGRLSPPGPLRPTSAEGLSLFRSFHHLVSTNLDLRVLFDENAITVLLPVDRAWKKLALTEKYLLSATAGDSLEKVLLYSIFRGVHYSKDLLSEPRKLTSLNGDQVTLHSDGEHLVFDDLQLKLKLDERDILASNGVGHSLSEVPIPPKVLITPENLINATGSSAWRDIVQQKNLQEYLQLNSNYTLLVPTDKAIELSEINSLNAEAMKSLIDFHIIPPIEGKPPTDLLTDTEVTQRTLSGGAILVHQVYPDIWAIHVNGSRTSARVLDHGRTSNGAQILLIDTVLFKPTQTKWVWAKPLAVIIFAAAMIVIITSAVRFGIQKWRSRRSTKPLFSREEDNDEESQPFLNGGTS